MVNNKKKLRLMKVSEARILIMLSCADPHLRFAKHISYKLNIDYCYLLKRLSDMVENGWLKKTRRENKAFYDVKPSAPLSLAYNRV